jgi:hypothetical protein
MRHLACRVDVAECAFDVSRGFFEQEVVEAVARSTRVGQEF